MQNFAQVTKIVTMIVVVFTMANGCTPQPAQEALEAMPTTRLAVQAEDWEALAQQDSPAFLVTEAEASVSSMADHLPALAVFLRQLWTPGTVVHGYFGLGTHDGEEAIQIQLYRTQQEVP